MSSFRDSVDFAFILICYMRVQRRDFASAEAKILFQISQFCGIMIPQTSAKCTLNQRLGGFLPWLRNLRARKPNKTCWKPSRENLWRAISTPTSHRRRARTAMCRLPNSSRQPRRTRRNTPKCGSSCWRAAKSRIPQRTCCTQLRARTPSGQTCPHGRGSGRRGFPGDCA